VVSLTTSYYKVIEKKEKKDEYYGVPGNLLRNRSGIWRVNASLDRGDILYAHKTAGEQ